MYCKGDWKILQLVLRCFLPMCYLLFWLLGLVLLASLFFSWLSIESSWSSRVQRVSLWTLRIRYCCALLFCFFISFASLFRCFSFSRVLCFCHFAFAFLFSLIFTSMSCGIIFICLLVGPCCFLVSFCQCCYCLFDVFGSFQWDVADYFALDYFFESLPFGSFIA